MQFSYLSLLGLAAALANLTAAAPTASASMDIAAARLLPVTPGVYTSGDQPSASSNVTTRELNKRNNGYLQVEWSFEVRDFIETLTFSQTDTISFRWWANGDQNTQPSKFCPIQVSSSQHFLTDRPFSLPGNHRRHSRCRLQWTRHQRQRILQRYLQHLCYHGRTEP